MIRWKLENSSFHIRVNGMADTVRANTRHSRGLRISQHAPLCMCVSVALPAENRNDKYIYCTCKKYFNCFATRKSRFRTFPTFSSIYCQQSQSTGDDRRRMKNSPRWFFFILSTAARMKHRKQAVNPIV